MFQNEIEWSESITTVLDNDNIFEDLQLIISDNGVFIRQWNENLQFYHVIEMSHEMFVELQTALECGEGIFQLEKEDE